MTRTSILTATLFLAAASSPAMAQYDQSQLTRPAGAADLNSNLARLASNPRDVAALIGAGEAALALDDPRAAAGFFARADAAQPGNGRIKAGLARVMLKLQNPAEALRLFNEAARLGYPDASVLSDRALARDMTGDQAGAQRDYQAALARTPQDDELIRRYAASLGISGQIEAADKVLEPLLYKSDRAAWRYRAFIYAMNNKQAEARKVALQTMPEQLASAITPYMQKMPYLTAAQKAAAVHFGHFPQQVGSTIVAIVPTPPAPGVTVARAPVTVAAAPAAATKPLSRSERRRQEREAQRTAQAEARVRARQAATTQPVRTASAPTTQPLPTQSRPSQTQIAQAQSTPPRAAQPRIVQAQTPPPTSTPVPSSAAPTQPSPAPSNASPAAVDPTPRPAPAPTQTAPTAVASSQPAASASARPEVQGPPAPGFDTIDAAARAPQPGAAQQPAATQPAATQPAASPAPAGVALAQTIQPTPAAPAPTTTPLPNPEATRTLADIIRAIDVPETERAATVAAVNLDEVAALQAQRRVERQTAAKAAADKAKKDAAAKAKAEADARAKKEAEEKKRLAANPSRNWLQVGVGQSKSALGFTMKRLRGKYATLAAQDAWSAAWGRTNRLLVGPFSSFTRARDLETRLKADGADVFAWKSDAGEVVEKLGGD